MGEPTQRDVDEGEIEKRVEEIIDGLERDEELASHKVTPRSSIEFWDALCARAQERRDALREENPDATRE